MAALQDKDVARELVLDENSRVLLIGTEGATDPAIYHAITGIRV